MAKVKLTKTTTSDPLGTVNKLKTYVGFSTVNRDFDSNTLYDYELARTDLLNAFYIKKGEKLENPNYGTIIYDTLFEPFTPEISSAIEEDVINIVDADPRWTLDTLRVNQVEYGLNLALEITILASRYCSLCLLNTFKYSLIEWSLASILVTSPIGWSSSQ